MSGGTITILNPNQQTLTLDFTPNGIGWFDAPAMGGGDVVTFPLVVSDASVTLYSKQDGWTEISVVRNGVEIANGVGNTRLQFLSGGANLTFYPGAVDFGQDELDNRFANAVDTVDAASGAVLVPEIAGDGDELDEAEVEPDGGNYALGVDLDGDLAFYDGSAWVKVALVGHTHG